MSLYVMMKWREKSDFHLMDCSLSTEFAVTNFYRTLLEEGSGSTLSSEMMDLFFKSCFHTHGPHMFCIF